MKAKIECLHCGYEDDAKSFKKIIELGIAHFIAQKHLIHVVEAERDNDEESS